MERMNICGRAFLHSVVFILLIFILESWASPDDPVMGMFPKDPLMATGDNLTVICNHTFKNPSTGKNAKDLYFYFNNIPYNSSSSGFWVVDENTAQLQIPRMTRNFTNKHIYCYLDDLPVLDHIVIRVKDPPIKPQLEECVVYNWDNMTCRWGPPQPEGVVTSLSWSVLSHTDTKYRCPHYTMYNCTWKKSDKKNSLQPGSYFLSIAANHTDLEEVVWSDEEEVNTYWLVKPNPVKEFKAESENSRTFKLSWEAPIKETLLKRVRYNYSVKSEYGSQSHTTNKTSVTVSGLTPYTEYTVSVKCIPWVKNYTVSSRDAYQEAGHWSNQVTISHRTLEDVPGSAPRVSEGSFYNDMIEQHHERGVTLLWQDIPKKAKHGDIKSWKISYRSLALGAKIQEENITNTNKFYHDMQGLHSNQSYKFTINAATDKGVNESLQLKEVIVASDLLRPPPPEDFAVFGNASGVYLRWEKVDGVSGYAVYYCLGSPQQNTCKDGTSVEWIQVEPQNPSVALFVNEGKDVFSYIFAVSCEKRVVLENGEAAIASSGMTWSDCTYQIGKALKPPREFGAQPLPDYGMRLTWEKPGCAETGYITGYEIQYCQVDLCEQDWTKLEIQNDSRHLEIPKLEPEMTYRVRIRSLSDSPEEKSVFVELDKAFTVTQSGLTRTHLILVIVGSIIAAILIIVGLVAAIRYCKKKVDRYRNVQIEPPERFDGPLEDEPDQNGKEELNEQNIKYVTTQTQEQMKGPGNGHVNLYMNGQPGERQNGYAQYKKGSLPPHPTGPENIALLSDQDQASPPRNSGGSLGPSRDPGDTGKVPLIPEDNDSYHENVPALDSNGFRPPGGQPQDSHNESAGLDSGLSSMMAYSAVQPTVNSGRKITPQSSGVSGITPYSQLDGQQSANGTPLPAGNSAQNGQTLIKADTSPYSVPSDSYYTPDDKGGRVEDEREGRESLCDKTQPRDGLSVDTAGQTQLNDRQRGPPNKLSVPPPGQSYVSDVTQFISPANDTNDMATLQGSKYEDQGNIRNEADVKNSKGLSPNSEQTYDVDGKHNAAPIDKDSGSYGDSSSGGGNLQLPHGGNGFVETTPKAPEYITQDLFSQLGTPVT